MSRSRKASQTVRITLLSRAQPSTLAKVRDLRLLIWLTPFISDGMIRAELLRATDAIAADLAAGAR